MSTQDTSGDFEVEVQRWMAHKGTPPFVDSPAWREAQRRLGAPNVQIAEKPKDDDPKPKLSFTEWRAKYAPKDSGEDYDLRGAYEAGVVPNKDGHFPDTYKKSNHPTFSVESKYWKPGMAAGRWENEKFIPMSPDEAAKWKRKYPDKKADTGGQKVPY